MRPNATVERLHRQSARDAQEIAALRRALRDLYEATHGYLNWGGDPRRLDVPADRLQDALVQAHAALRCAS